MRMGSCLWIFDGILVQTTMVTMVFVVTMSLYLFLRNGSIKMSLLYFLHVLVPVVASSNFPFWVHHRSLGGSTDQRRLPWEQVLLRSTGTPLFPDFTQSANRPKTLHSWTTGNLQVVRLAKFQWKIATASETQHKNEKQETTIQKPQKALLERRPKITMKHLV